MFLILYFIHFVSFQSPVVEEHAIYLSTITISVSNQVVDVEIKVFEDDLRDAIRNHNGYSVDTASIKFVSSVDKYLKEHLKIKTMNSVWESEVKDVDRVGDSYQIRYAPVSIELANQVTIEADYFMELFPTQQNILELKTGSQKFYHIFKNGQSITDLDLTH